MAHFFEGQRNIISLKQTSSSIHWVLLILAHHQPEPKSYLKHSHLPIMIQKAGPVYKLLVQPPNAASSPASDTQPRELDTASFAQHISTLPSAFQELAALISRSAADLREVRDEIRGYWAQLGVYSFLTTWEAQLALQLGADAHDLIERERQSRVEARRRQIRMLQERQERLQAIHNSTVARFIALCQQREDEESEDGAVRNPV
ncbi:hypothetical protein MAPG_06124 [Magnaporthiopsis poae ATCC 64411]|uniref:Uncharacterized protein n=1 Tax=Magnaporthiopsis poae (strain ATCC 64411 / 73-15) TaxID=644358 RepID=A0A0C4E173_MAGP6|nr:hypothetical protein MAPG_06124 [Magnaporthiopsis poae ATCC 64411]